MPPHEFKDPDVRVLAEQVKALQHTVDMNAENYQRQLDNRMRSLEQRIDETHQDVREVGTDVERQGREFNQEISELSESETRTEATLTGHLGEHQRNEGRSQWALGLAITSIVTAGVTIFAFVMLR